MSELREVASSERVIALSVDKSTDCSDQSNMTVHIYFFRDFQRQHAFVPVLPVRGSPNAKNLTQLSLDTIKTHLKWSAEELAQRVVTFACDGLQCFRECTKVLVSSCKPSHHACTLCTVMHTGEILLLTPSQSSCCAS